MAVGMKHRTANRHTPRTSRRKELDPTFYPDIFAFRKAVEAGTVDPAKGCQNMDEYLASVVRKDEGVYVDI